MIKKFISLLMLLTLLLSACNARVVSVEIQTPPEPTDSIPTNVATLTMEATPSQTEPVSTDTPPPMATPSLTWKQVDYPAAYSFRYPLELYSVRQENTLLAVEPPGVIE